jgi:glycerol-3-phosphate acyltransferase PlsY
MGSISSAVWVSKTLFKVDIRQHGSKNAGATNVLRVLGWKAGLLVFVTDFAKGVLAVCLVYFTALEKSTELPGGAVSGWYIGESDTFAVIQIVLGLAVVLGHIFPVFASFRGGKGVATMAGVVLAIFPAAMLVALGVFLLCLLLSRYVSLSSIVAALFLPFIVIVVFGCWAGRPEPLTLQAFSLMVTVMILITHRHNIKRLWKGEEHKIVFNKHPSIQLPDDDSFD